MSVKLKKSLLFIIGAIILLAITIAGLEFLKSQDTENWQGTALYGIKAAPDDWKPSKKEPVKSLQEMRDFVFGKDKPK